MDNIRLFLWLGIGLMLWLNYEAWLQDYPPAPPTQVSDSAPIAAPPPDVDLPVLPEAAPANQPEPQLNAPEATPEQAADTIRISTDVMEVQISPIGGDLVRVDLPGYPREKDRPDALEGLIGNPGKLRQVRQNELKVFKTLSEKG